MKKFLSILLIVSLVIISTLPVMAVENTMTSEYCIGDVDLDGRLSIKDATLIQKHIANIVAVSEYQMDLADVDNNGNVNVKDVTMIQKKLAGLISEFPAENESSKDEVPATTTPDETVPEVTEAPAYTTEIATAPVEDATEATVATDPATTSPDETVPDTTEISTNTTENVTEPTITETNTEKPTDPDVDPTEVTTSVPDVTETETTVSTLPTDSTENTTGNVSTDPTEPTTSETYPTEEPSNPTTLPTDITESESSETTETPTEPETTEPPTKTPTETPTESETTEPVEDPTEPETTESEATEPEVTEPDVTESEPTEPVIPDMKTYGPIDPIEGDILTAEMLWKIEEEFFRLVNEERVRVGVKPLTYNKHLDDIAQIRSVEIIELYSHTRPNGEIFWEIIDTDKYNWCYMGENVCYFYHIEGTFKKDEMIFTGSDEELINAAQIVFNAFKNSSGHYDSMIYEDFEHAGIGISYVWDTEFNIPKLYLSHDFGTVEK
ncbi:MAG: hypothetical protein IKK10_03185 [Clostridia bacterium]|nr:hypothetical protein [Clostridia bacterium]